MKKIIYTQADGSLAVVHPVINTHPVREDISEEQALQRAWDKLPADAINPQVVDESAIPSDRTFRNAWKAGVGAVDHDMEKAREIHKARLRELRAPKLSALDVEYMKADEEGNQAKKLSIAAAKKALRDVTKDPSIASAKTPEELKSVLPRVLQ